MVPSGMYHTLYYSCGIHFCYPFSKVGAFLIGKLELVLENCPIEASHSSDFIWSSCVHADTVEMLIEFLMVVDNCVVKAAALFCCHILPKFHEVNELFGGEQRTVGYLW